MNESVCLGRTHQSLYKYLLSSCEVQSPTVLITMKIIDKVDRSYSREGAVANDLEVPSSAFFCNSCEFLLTHACHIQKPNKTSRAASLWCMVIPHPFPPRACKGVVFCGFLVLVTPALGWEELQMEVFVEGSLLSLVVSSLSSYVINESFTAFSPSPLLSALSWTLLPKVTSVPGAFDFLWAP